VRPVGSTQTVKVDVRIIAATHMPLEERIERGTFRRDLYARLAGYTFTAPPLRDRRGDLGLLVAALLAAGKLGAGRDVHIQADAARALVRHAWPMNVRELEQCLAAACVLAEDGVITLEDLPPAVAGALATGSEPEDSAGTPDAAPGGASALTIGSDQRARLAALIAEHEGNLSAVARVLQTSRSQVQRLMARYGIAGKSP
jgi:transcriptional regulator with GAF, ATPase, and Fis domain